MVLDIIHWRPSKFLELSNKNLPIVAVVKISETPLVCYMCELTYKPVSDVVTEF